MRHVLACDEVLDSPAHLTGDVTAIEALAALLSDLAERSCEVGAAEPGLEAWRLAPGHERGPDFLAE